MSGFESFDLLAKVEKLETDEADKPVQECKIVHCGVLVRKSRAAEVKKSKKKKSRRKRSHSSDGSDDGDNKKAKEDVEEEEEDQGVLSPGGPGKNWLDRTQGGFQ